MIYNKPVHSVTIALSLALCSVAASQEFYTVDDAEPQPLIALALRLDEALEFLGSPLNEADHKKLQELSDAPHDEALTQAIQEILDPYCLAMVHINPEMRAKVAQGPAPPVLQQGGWKSFLVKVHNESGTNAALEVESPNAQPALHVSSGKSRPEKENELTPGQSANRFLDVRMNRRRPLRQTLSGLTLEYAVVQIYTNEVGPREARLGFNVGQGTQDLGFRNTIDVLFECRRSVKVVFRVRDFDGTPTTASFVIKDGIDRAENSDLDYRWARARGRAWAWPKAGRLVGIYPLPSRRVAATDEYPDFYFQPQVYRADGEHVFLPPGTYDVTYTRGPEYLQENRTITVPEGVDTHVESFDLKRWIRMTDYGWYSGDHHVHAGGCSHYESPEAGVRPLDIFRQALGEDLNVACVLTWGPCWYHQKQYFEGQNHVLSTGQNLLRYDVEVSGFPSSHAGHVCLLRLEEDDYPGTTVIEEWPSWTLPVMQWAQGQGGVTGYAHSGWGLRPIQRTYFGLPRIWRTYELPNYVMANFNGIGANEYIVTVTHDAVDFISTTNTPVDWELNIWYHTLNCGFRTRISGETDFPCIYDDRIGRGRSYVKLDNGPGFDAFVESIKAGNAYVSDGKSHIIDFRADDTMLGTAESELNLDGRKRVRISAKVAAYLPKEQDSVGKHIASSYPDVQPYWDIERARIRTSRKVLVELVVNGIAVERKKITANGDLQNVSFKHRFKRSSWVALRVYPSSHTNPIFVLVDGKPIRASRKSAEWCRAAVDRCWEMKSPLIRDTDLPEAKKAYDFARNVYQEIIEESAG